MSAPLKKVAETYVGINGIEIEGNGLKVGGEDAVESPLQVGVDQEMLVGLELAAGL